MKINNNVQNVLNKTNDSYKRSYQMLEITICYVKKGLCISKRKEEFIYTRNRHIGPACAPSIDRGVQNQA